jgi:hypothetical protein
VEEEAEPLRRTGSTFVLYLLLYCTQLSAAGELEVRVQKSEVYRGESLIVEIAVEDADSVEHIKLPEVENVESSYAGISRSVEIYNFNRSTKLILRYVFISNVPGRYTIPSFDVLVDGNRETTKEFSFTVLDGDPPVTNRYDPFSMFDEMMNPRRRRRPQTSFASNIQISKDVVYSGETIVARYYVLADQNVLFRAGGINLGNVEGLIYSRINEIIPDRVVDYNNQRKIRRHASTYTFVPTYSGNFRLNNQAVVVEFQINDGIFPETFRRRVQINDRNIDVLPLPNEGKPTNFSGNIGFYSMSMKISDEKEILQLDEYPITITIRGRGSMQNLQPPIIPRLPENVSLVLTDTTEDYKLSNGTYQGSITYSYILISEDKGRLLIQPFKFNYFNPANAAYKEIKTEEFSLQVLENITGNDESIETNNYEIERDIFMYAGLGLFTVLCVVYFMFQFINEQKKRKQFYEQVNGIYKKDNKSIQTNVSEVKPQELYQLYAFELNQALMKGDSGQIKRKILSSVDFLLGDGKKSGTPVSKLNEIKDYIRRASYAGGTLNIELLKKIATELAKHLKTY